MPKEAISRPFAGLETEKTVEASIHNRFDIEVRDAKTGALKQRAQAFNVICDKLWEYFLTGGWFKYIAYGNGTGTPSSSDTNLFGTANYAELSNVKTVVNAEQGVCYRTRKVTLSETTAVGFTFRELGLSYYDTTNYLCTHAMIQDMNGNPISIYKSSTDIITLYATVYGHWTPSGYGKIKIPPKLIAWNKPDNFLAAMVGHGINLGYFVQYQGLNYTDLVKVGLGTAVTHSTIADKKADSPTVTWSKTTKRCTVKLPRVRVEKGNIDGGFGWVKIANGGSASSDASFAIIDVRGEYEVTNEAVGTGNGTTLEYKTKFDFPSNATVLVDGVVSDAEVRTIPRDSNAYNYLIQIENFLYNGELVYRCDKEYPYYDVGWVGYFYNPLWETGMQSFSGSSYYRFSFSDDLETWSEPMAQGTIPEEYRHCKYLHITNSSTSTNIANPTIRFPDGSYGNNIIFSEPPQDGSVITVSYTTPFVPKDENHVYDLTFSVQFGEYAGEDV